MPEAIPVFDDPDAITITDDESDADEQRFVTLGMGAAARLLVVAYTWRGKNIRIISGQLRLGGRVAEEGWRGMG